MKNILFDTNIILDIALKRELFYEEAFQLFQFIETGEIIGNVTACTISAIYYISKKNNGHEQSIGFIKQLVEMVEILGVDKSIIINALTTHMSDFEDAIQNSSAEMNGIDLILTRNKKDFKNSTVKILTPLEFLETQK